MVKFYCLSFLLFFCSAIAFGQTKGLIYKPATSPEGRAVLDPNLDGYTSATTQGYISNDRGDGESEIKYKPFPVLSDEPTQDLLKGPGCGFTDVVDSGADDPVMFYFDGTNFLIRFRLNKTSPNTKGYSVLIDTDERFGFSGPEADPNAVVGNPGFEMELVLTTNQAVSLYNVDGSTNPVLLVRKDYDSHTQKSVAYTEECGDPDYFYDYYLPWADFGLSADTKLRMAAVTVLGPAPAIGSNSKSDVGGVDDRIYAGNYDQLFWDLISYYRPTAPGDMNTTPLTLSRCPIITSEVYANSTSVSGSSVEADGTVIELYKNANVLLGTTTVSFGSWQITGISGLAQGDLLTAVATAPKKSASDNCSTTLVKASYTPPCTNAYKPTNVSAVNIRKGVIGNILVPAATNLKIKVYLDGSLIHTSGVMTFSGSSAGTSNEFCFKQSATGYTMAVGANCQSGAPIDLQFGVYQFVAVSADNDGAYTCTSAPANLCLGTTEASAAPVITTALLYENTASISGTAGAGSFLSFKVNGTEKWTLKLATGVVNWTLPVSGLKFGDVFSVVAIEPGKCFSNEVSKTVTGPQTAAPVITGTYCATAGGTSLFITGTSTEQDGTIVELFRGATSLGTTTVYNGTWSKSALVNGGDVLTAKATAPRMLESVVSNAVNVNVSLSGSSIVITGPLIEGTATVSGTTTSAGTIKLYIDGFYLSETTTTGTSWTITGLASYDLYAGGSLTATVTPTGACESEPSQYVLVDCIPPLTNMEISPASTAVCSGETTTLTVKTSEAFVIYQLYNGAEKTGTSLLGNGGDIVLTSGPLSADAVLSIRAIKISTVACYTTLDNTLAVTVNPVITNNTVTEPLAGTSFCGNSEVGEIGGSVPEGGDGTYTYQWQKSIDNTTWEDIEGATGQNYIPGAVAETSYFRRWVMSGACAEVNASAVVTITIHPSITNELNYTGESLFCDGGQPVEITGSTDDAITGYQWQVSTDNTTWTDLDGATAANYAPGSITETTHFRRKVTTSTCETYSNTVTFTVFPALTNNSISAPASVVLCNSGSVEEITGSTSEGGDGTYTYRWQVSTDNGNSFTDIVPAVTSQSYSPGEVNQTTYFKRIVETGACSPSESNSIKISVVSAANSTITADANTLPADGTSSTTIRVQLKDLFDTDVTSEACVLALTSDVGSISNITYISNGEYTATLTSSTNDGVATISGTINGEAMTQLVEVTFTQTVKMVATTVTASPASVPADGASTSLARLSFKDYNGNAIAMDDAKVELLLDGIAVTVTAKGNGVYEAVVPARVSAGTVLVSAKYDGIDIANNASVTFYSQVNQTATSITATPAQVNADGVSTSTVQVAFRDYAGNGIAMDASKLVVYAEGVAMASVQDLGNGVYEVMLPGRTTAETVSITAAYNGAALPGSATVTFIPVVNPAATTVAASPEQVNADGVSTATATLSFFDYAGKSIVVDASKVSILLDEVAVALTEKGNGVFEAVVPASTSAALVKVTATYNSAAVAAQAEVNFIPVARLTAAEVTATPSVVDADGISTSTATVIFRDYDGNPVVVDGADVEILLNGTAVAATATGTGLFTTVVPATTVAGTVTVTAKYNGSLLADDATVNFVPAVNLTVADVAATPEIVPTDGASTAVASVSFKDYSGNPVAIEATKVKLKFDGVSVAITADGTGVFTATVPASIHAKTVNITAEYDGAVISDEASVSFVPVVNLAATKVAASPAIVPADGESTSTATLSFFDYAGNAVLVDDAKVELLLDGIAVTVTAKGNGVYEAVVPARVSAGTVLVSAKYDGADLADNASVTFYSQVNQTATTLTANPVQVNADGVSTSTIRVSFHDYAGNGISMDASRLVINADGVTMANVQDLGNGVFEAILPGRTTAETVTVTASYDGAALAGNATVTFVPVVKLAATTVKATPERLDADGASTSLVQVAFFDYAGNAIAVDMQDVEVLLNNSTVNAINKGNGVFEATVPARSQAERVIVTAKYKGATAPSQAEVVFVMPAPALVQSTVVANPTTVVADGVSISTITVQLKDANGNNTISDKEVTITSSLGTLSSVVSNGDGSYTAQLSSTVTGEAIVKAYLGSEELSSKPTVTFIPGSASKNRTTITASEPAIPANGTSTSVITVTLFDNQGNRIFAGGETVALSTTLGSLGAVTDHGDGTYTCVLTSSTTFGTAEVSGTINGAAIDNTASVAFTAINRAPIAVDDSYMVNNHERFNGNVLANDTDPDGDQLTAKTALVRMPLFGSVILQPDGSFIYTPGKGYVGEDSFTYQVCDNGNPALCAEATVTIQVKQGQVFIPEGFSPDGDGENDLFTIYGAEAYKVSLKVFNRWGTIVYESKDYRNDWNGQANSGVVFGKMLPDGTYFYIIDLNNGEKPRTHSLIVKRK